MNSDNLLSDLLATRKNMLKTVTGLTLEQLNTIPKGLNNNIIWNLAHCAVTQQLLCYKLSGTAMHVTSDLVKSYAKGSKPEGDVDQAFVDAIKTRLINSVDQIRKDYDAKIFGEYKEYTTSFGVTLGSVEDAIRFNNVHEAMHLGNILVMKRLV